MYRKFSLIVLAFLLISCAGTPFEWTDTAKIHNGMTEAEVVAILGKPYSRTQSGATSILTWGYSAYGQGSKAVSYAFKDGRVTGQTTVGK